MQASGWSIIVLALGLGLCPPARAQELPSWQGFVGDSELDLGGSAGGALFTGDLPRQPSASGYLKLNGRLHRDYDSGLSLGANATLSVSDALSQGRYDGKFFEKFYGEMRTGLGWLQLGLVDGGAYALAVTGPKVDAAVSLDDPQTVFFRDPASGRAFNRLFPLRTEIGASSNDAKIAYVSPALFGVQLAFSFTPNQSRAVLPFLQAGPHLPGRPADIWEGSLRYTDDIGPVSLAAYVGFAEGRAEHKLPGQEGVSDLGAGLRADYPVDDDMTLSLGGSYRQSNAHAFDIDQSWQAGVTRAGYLSASLSYGDWLFGAEYGNGSADAVSSLPQLDQSGYQVSLGYALTPGLQLTGGWQRFDYRRSSGSFFNGAPRIPMDVAFLHLGLHTAS